MSALSITNPQELAEYFEQPAPVIIEEIARPQGRDRDLGYENKIRGNQINPDGTPFSTHRAFDDNIKTFELPPEPAFNDGYVDIQAILGEY